jgi:predicted alpha/beta-hydrolase family hydrolase
VAVEFEVAFDGKKVTALHYAAEGKGRPALVLGHGAGADQRHAFMVHTAGALAARGVDVVTYNFLYTEERRKAPDKPVVLEACCRAALRAARERLGQVPLFGGGKSMGGRIASQVVAGGEGGILGLVFLGYPLHPPGRPDELRDKHLARIEAPMLFVQGSRDAFGTPEELAPVLARLGGRARIHVVEGGDHSFHVPKKGGAPQVEVDASIVDVVFEWITSR